MKKGLIFATTLAMALGVGVAVGAHQNEVAEVKAATKTTIYYAVTTSYTVKCNVRYGSYDSDPWETFEMTKTDNTFGGVPVYTCSFTDKYDGLGIMQLQQYDGGTWISQVVAFDTWTAVSTYNGKIYDGSWKTYTPDGQTHKVTPVVDGTAETAIDVVDGSTPVLKDNTYGKTFDGWYTASDYKTKVTEITSDCSVYGRFVDKETATYTIDDGYAKKFDTYNVYAWNEDGKNAEWPGLAVNGKSVTVPVDASFIINDGVASQTVDISQEGAKAYLQLLSETDESGCFKVQWSDAAQEVPASEGYYIKGSASEWKYVAANKMSTEDLYEGDVAQFIGFEAKANDEIRICSYYTDRSPFEQWASLQDGESEVGTLVGHNLKFTADGTYDVYAKYVNNQFLFDVVNHAERVTVTVFAKQYAGSYCQGETSALYEDTDVIKGQPFTVPDVTPEGYVALGVYSDSDCTVPFESGVTPVESNMSLYIKAMQLGWYLAGGEDETFSVENSMKLGTSAGNKCTGAVEVPEGTTDDNPFVVKPLEFVADAGSGTPGWAPATYEMGHKEEPAFVHIDEDTNFAFTVPGTYAFYVNDENKVWFNGGEYAYIEDFLSHTGTVCHAQGTQTDLETLQLLWSQFEEGFKGLSEDEIQDIKDVGFNGGDEESDDAKLRMVARYAYIITKYGTGMFKDFIWGQKVEARQSSLTFSSSDVNNSTMIIVISIAAVSALAFTTLLVFKKRKQK